MRLHWNRQSVIFSGAALWGLLFVACVAANRAVLAPPQVPGAKFVGSEECALCHSEITDHFGNSTHARLAMEDGKVGNTGCEACHGPGSIHANAGGGRNNIVNPGKSPEACFACHLDKRGEFSLPNTHPVLSGKMSCTDCHDVHTGDAVRGVGATMDALNDTCTKCHTAQKGPFVFEHGAMKEGCIACHSPHGSVNQRMLIARDANLCLRCHLEDPGPNPAGVINANAVQHTPENHNTRLMQGTCWSAGCHEAPHGSNANNHVRR